MGTTAHNGVSASSLIAAVWRKSSRSGAIGNCVELAPLAGDEIAVRNSRDPRGPALIYSTMDLSGFLARVKDGEFRGAGH
ncbi:MAG TPA: DUF397 domain-containing protein [Pseudonocardiaceae bacterium]|nr:DUF397 domain-containing protein [Pseudonocardiaceae bacterium]